MDRGSSGVAGASGVAGVGDDQNLPSSPSTLWIWSARQVVPFHGDAVVGAVPLRANERDVSIESRTAATGPKTALCPGDRTVEAFPAAGRIGDPRALELRHEPLRD